MQATSLWVMITQFLLSYFIGTSLSAFWGLINSQQNLAYLPILSINNPAPVSFYLEFLVEIAGFDPIPIDIVYDLLGIWDFTWVDLAPDNDSFANIGIEDRNFIMGLGSMFVFLVGFVFCIFFTYLLKPCRNIKVIKWFHSKVQVEGYIRVTIITFIIEGYIDLFLSGLINTENNYLFDYSENWGFNGNLSISDQFSIILGNFIFLLCLAFLPFSLFILDNKS